MRKILVYIIVIFLMYSCGRDLKQVKYSMFVYIPESKVFRNVDYKIFDSYFISGKFTDTNSYKYSLTINHSICGCPAECKQKTTTTRTLTVSKLPSNRQKIVRDNYEFFPKSELPSPFYIYDFGNMNYISAYNGDSFFVESDYFFIRLDSLIRRIDNSVALYSCSLLGYNYATQYFGANYDIDKAKRVNLMPVEHSVYHCLILVPADINSQLENYVLYSLTGEIERIFMLSNEVCKHSKIAQEKLTLNDSFRKSFINNRLDSISMYLK